MVTLPVAFLSLIPSGAGGAGLFDAIRVLTALFPFKPALQAMTAALDPAGSGIGGPLLHLAILVVASGSGAAIEANAVDGNELQRRTYPDAGGGYRAAGYEFIRGLKLVERRTPRGREGYPSGLVLRIDHSELAGTVLLGEPRVTRVGSFRVDLVPEGRFLVSRHEDRPGVVGQIGTILGEADVNIASMQVGRDAPREGAMMFLTIDDAVGEAVLKRLAQVPGIAELRYVELGD